MVLVFNFYTDLHASLDILTEDALERVFTFLSPNEVGKVAQVNRDFKDKASFEILRKESAYGIVAENGEHLFGREALWQKKVIIEFNDFLTFVDSVPDKIWQEDVSISFFTAGEEEYLKTLSNWTQEKLTRYCGERESELLKKSDWLRHVYSLLFTMRAYNIAISLVAKEAAFNFIKNIASADSNPAEKYAANYAANVATNYAANDSVWKAANYASFQASMHAGVNAGFHAAFHAAFDLGFDNGLAQVTKMLELELRKELLHPLNPRQIGLLTYKMAEKDAILFFLKHSSKKDFGIMDVVYQAAHKHMKSDFGTGIFSSVESWNQFKEEYFGELDENQMLFLRPWLVELERVILFIEEMVD